MKHLRHQNYKNEHTAIEYLNNIQKTPQRNNLLELQNDFKELNDRELRNMEINNKKEIDEIFFKLMKLSINVMDKFKEKEMANKRPFRNDTLNYWLIKY